MEKEYNNPYLMPNLSLSSGLYPSSAHILFKSRGASQFACLCTILPHFVV